MPAEKADRRTRLLELAFPAVPIAALLVAAWSRRWTADDGFINFRVVDQIVAGNGPVFNAGERVEIATSPAWIALLTVASRIFFFIRLEWVAVFLAMALAVAAFALAWAGARSLHGMKNGRAVLPVGLAIFVAPRPVWDFVTSGLEVSLSLAWLAACFFLLARLAADERGERALLVSAVVVGLGPLVRPDFVTFSAAFGVALLVLGRPWSWRRLVKVAAAAGTLPVAYQLFRMAYYAALVPNTAFAKEAGLANWGQGSRYVVDFVGTYAVWAPLALVVVVLAASRWSTRALVVVAACAAGGALHWLYIVRVGGDFMHGRLLLPGLFAVLLPAAAVPARRVVLAAAAAAVVWAVVAASTLRPQGYVDGVFSPHHIADERAYYTRAAGRPHPVTVDDYRRYWAQHGFTARDELARGRRQLFLEDLSFGTPMPGVNRFDLPPGEPDAVVVFRFIGMLSYAAGTEVFVVDRLGLGDPIASRITMQERGRPGHEKELDIAWPAARFLPPDTRFPTDPPFEARVIAARQALQCDPIRRILDAVNEPLSLGRMVGNVRVALTTYGTRISGHPPSDAAACAAPRERT